MGCQLLSNFRLVQALPDVLPHGECPVLKANAYTGTYFPRLDGRRWRVTRNSNHRSSGVDLVVHTMGVHAYRHERGFARGGVYLRGTNITHACSKPAKHVTDAPPRPLLEEPIVPAARKVSRATTIGTGTVWGRQLHDK